MAGKQDGIGVVAAVAAVAVFVVAHGASGSANQSAVGPAQGPVTERVQADSPRPMVKLQKRTGGTRSWRNRNPGNLRYTAWARAHGAVGRDEKGFSVFPTDAAGAAAAGALLQRHDYAPLTLSGAIARWAPSSDGNDPVRYAASVSRQSGVALDRQMGSLSRAELAKVVVAIKRYEGWRAGS